LKLELRIPFGAVAMEDDSPPEDVRRLMHEVQRRGAHKNIVDRALAGGESREAEDVGDAWTLA